MTQILITEVDMTPVSSTCILAVGHKNGRLVVEFANRGTYVYGYGSDKLFDQFLAAPSKGRFINYVLKPAYDGILIR